MPSFTASEGRSKPWRARVKYQGTPIFLGYYHTEAEARAEEEKFWVTYGGRQSGRYERRRYA